MARAIDSLKQIRQHRQELSRSFAEGRCCDAEGKALRILGDYLNFLELELSGQGRGVSVGEVQEMLLELSCVIRRAAEHLGPAEYRDILRRLVSLYAGGLRQRRDEVFSMTAADYAEVIEAISLAYPEYDYSEAIGQLLFYMNHLYQLRKTSWVTVYEHLLSMPDSIRAIQVLKEKHFLEIQGWAEEGVHNLFSIHRDLSGIIEELSEEISELDRTLGQHAPGSSERKGSNVISLVTRRKRLEILSLRECRQRLVDERDGKLHVADLIETNIREFESKLKEARRAYFVRLVFDASGTQQDQGIPAKVANG